MSPRSAFGEISWYRATANILSVTLQFLRLRINKLSNAAYIHISVNSAVELLSRDTTLIHNHKSTLYACFKAFPFNVSFTRCSDVHFSEPIHPKSVHEKARKTAPDYTTKLSFELILSKHTRFMYWLGWLCAYVQKKSKQPIQMDACLYIRCVQVLKGQN